LPFFHLKGIAKKWIVAVFLLKIVAGVAMYWIYSNHYEDRSTADIFKYFDDSEILYGALSEQPGDYFQMLLGVDNDNAHFDLYYRKMNNWYREYESNLYNDSHTIIRFNAFVRLFSFGYYNVHTVFMCFLALLGSIALFRAFQRYFGNKEYLLFTALLLIPSVLFWTSGVLKEGLLIFGLGFLLLSVFSLLHNPFRWKHVFVIPLALLLLFHLKFYVLIGLLPALIGYGWVTLTKGKHVALKYLIVGGCCIGGVILLPYINPRWDALDLIVRKQHDFIRLAEVEQSGSQFELTPLTNNWSSVLRVTPEALGNSFFRPYPHRITNSFALLSFLENVGFALVFLFSLWMATRKKIPWNVLLFCVSFVLVLYLIIGLTTPVEGAIVRYKVPAMPFLMLSFLLFLDQEKLSRLIQRVRFGKRH